MSEQQREEREVVLQFQPKHERRPHSAPHHHVKRMGTDEERIKIRMALRALDERDLESNIVHWLKHVAIQGSDETPKLLLMELFHGLDSSNVNGRKQRFRLARHLVTTSPYVEVHDIVPAIVRTLVKRASEEKSQGLYEEEAKFLQDLTDSALTLARLQDNREWVQQTLAKPFLDVVSKTLDGRKIAGCCRHMQALLSAFSLSTHIELDVSQSIAKDILRRLSKLFHHHRSTTTKIPEVFSVLERCVEVVQLEISTSATQTMVELFVASVDIKDNWHVRKAGLSLLTTLSIVFVDAPKFPGDSEAREVLRKYMGVIQGCLDKARYDKIVHVRKAMQKAQAAFNGIELVSFQDYDVEMEDLYQRQVGARGNQRKGRPGGSAARKRFMRPKAKIGNDFGIQIFVPLEDDFEQNKENSSGYHHKQLHEDSEDQAAGTSSSGSPEREESPSESQGRREGGEASEVESRPFPEAFDGLHLQESAAFSGNTFQDSLVAEEGQHRKNRMPVSNQTLESLVTIHAQEIEKFYRVKEQDELNKLKTKFEKHFRKLQEAFERDTTKVKCVIQKAIEREIDFFKKDRLPKLAKLLSDKAQSASDATNDDS